MKQFKNKCEVPWAKIEKSEDSSVSKNRKFSYELVTFFIKYSIDYCVLVLKWHVCICYSTFYIISHYGDLEIITVLTHTFKRWQYSFISVSIQNMSSYW